MINDTKNKSIEQKKIANDTLLLDSTFCKNELELINSPSFIKVFEQILFQAEIPDINQEYILDIIEKILFKNKSQLTEKERLDFLHIINHKNLLEKAIKYYDIYKYTNNLEKNKISVYSIKRKLINESVIKRVLSIIELKKSKGDENGKINKTISTRVDGVEYLIFNSFYKPGERNPILKIIEKTGNKYLAAESGGKMCYFNKETLEKKGGSYDLVSGGLDVDGKLYYEIQDNSKYYVYADGEKLGPYPNISNIREFDGRIIANIEISRNKTIIDLKSEEIYYITKEGVLAKKIFEFKDSLLKESYFNSYNIELLDIDGTNNIKPILLLYFQGYNTFLKSLNDKPKKWKFSMENIKIINNKTISYNYLISIRNYWFINRKGNYEI